MEDAKELTEEEVLELQTIKSETYRRMKEYYPIIKKKREVLAKLENKYYECRGRYEAADYELAKHDDRMRDVTHVKPIKGVLKGMETQQILELAAELEKKMKGGE